MCASFVYRPHVETADGVFTPDIVVDHLSVTAGAEGAAETYRVSVERLTCDDEIAVLGRETRGQAAVALIASSAGTLIGIGSDHVDHALLPQDPARARQICAKPLSRQAWRLAEIAAHLDDLVLSAWTGDGNDRTAFAIGALSGFLRDGAIPRAGVVFVTGDGADAAPMHGRNFAVELVDRRLGRRLTHRYGVRGL